MKDLRFIALPFLVWTLPVHAAILARWDFQDNDFVPDEVGATLTVSNITTPPGNLQFFEVSNPIPSYATQPVFRFGPGDGTTTPAQAITNNDYWEFTVSPTPSTIQYDLTSLTFNAGRGGSSVPRGLVVRSSIDTFSSDLFSADVPTVRPAFTAFSIDLSGPSFQGLTSPITFRVYSYVPAAGQSIEIDDLILNGVVTPIPEPNSLVLAGFIAVAAMACYRHTRCRV